MKYAASLRMRAPVVEVFAYLSDRMRWPTNRWMSPEQLPPGPVALGTVFKVRYHRRKIDVLWTIVEFEPPHRVQFLMEWPGERPMSEIYTVSESAGATKVVHEADWPGPRHLTFLNPVWFALMRPIYWLGAVIGLRYARRVIERSVRQGPGSSDIGRR